MLITPRYNQTDHIFLFSTSNQHLEDDNTEQNNIAFLVLIWICSCPEQVSDLINILWNWVLQKILIIINILHIPIIGPHMALCLLLCIYLFIY